MKLYHLSIVSLMLACSGCGQPFATHNTPQELQGAQRSAASVQQAASSEKRVPLQNGASPPVSYAVAGNDCGGRAQKRVAMFDRPSTYPISDQERHDAYLALYSACMREHDWQVAGPARGGNDASMLANLSPAAGGAKPVNANTVTAGNAIISTTSVPGATILVIGGGKDAAAQLGALSPASGGGTALPQHLPANATVVLVSPQPQSPVTAVPVAVPYAPAVAAAQPVAVPVPAPPMARGYAPVAKAVPVAPAAPAAHAAPAAPQVAKAAYAPAATHSLASAPHIPAETYVQERAQVASNEQQTMVADQPLVPLDPNKQLENVLEQ